jgi:hypothetical protein
MQPPPQRSFAWAQHPDTRIWWLVELENGEPRRAFRPPQGEPLRSEVPGETMPTAHLDSFCRWSLDHTPAPIAGIPPRPSVDLLVREVGRIEDGVDGVVLTVSPGEPPFDLRLFGARLGQLVHLEIVEDPFVDEGKVP